MVPRDLNSELGFFLNKLELIFLNFFNKIYIRVIFCFLFVKNVTLKVKYIFFLNRCSIVFLVILGII